MRNAFKLTAGALALVSAAQLQAAQTAATSCLNRDEVHGLVAYVLPDALDATLTTCSPKLGPDSFLARRGPKLAETLRTGKNAIWPQARSAFFKFGGEHTAELAKLKDATVRTMVDDLMSQKLAPAIKPSICGDVERILAPLEPLPTDNLVAFLSAIVSVAARKDPKLPTCPES